LKAMLRAARLGIMASRSSRLGKPPGPPGPRPKRPRKPGDEGGEPLPAMPRPTPKPLAGGAAAPFEKEARRKAGVRPLKVPVRTPEDTDANSARPL
jgi:hypothetical protein